MLIQFKVSNYGSIKDEVCHSMAANNEPESATELAKTFMPSVPGTKALVKASLIYGANAAGKSTLVKAMRTMQAIVLNSVKTQESDALPYKPFLLSNETKTAATEFEIEFIAGGIRYQYGFAYHAARISEEWLFAYPKGRPQKWIMRYEDDNEQTQFERCDSLSGSKKLWESATRDNALFLSTAVQLKSSQLKSVFDWFNNTLRFIGVTGVDHSLSIDRATNQDSKQEMLNFMRAADFSISDFAIEELEPQFSRLSEPGSSFVGTSQGEEIKLGHRAEDRSIEFLNLKDESDGTQKVFELAAPWLDTLKNGYVLVMDEMNLHLHPRLAMFLVKLFYNDKLNINQSQLIFTTHETSLLTEDLVRRDQVWLMNKLNNGSTGLEALTVFSARKNENLRKRYLDGRYGGVPLTGMADMLRDKEDA